MKPQHGPAEAEGKPLALPWLDRLGLGALRLTLSETLHPLQPLGEQTFWLLEPTLIIFNLRDDVRRWLAPGDAGPEQESR